MYSIKDVGKYRVIYRKLMDKYSIRVDFDKQFVEVEVSKSGFNTYILRITKKKFLLDGIDTKIVERRGSKYKKNYDIMRNIVESEINIKLR